MINNSLFLPKIHGSKGCFAAGQLVETKEGFKYIQDLKIGDYVASFDDKFNIHFNKVTEIFKTENQEIYRYYFWGDIKIEATQNHWILNQFNAFACIGSLTTQDMAINRRGHLIPFIKSQYIGIGTVYNVHIENDCTLFVNDLAFHNGGIDTAILHGQKGGKGGGGKAFTEDANNAQSDTTAKLLEAISCGEIVGLVNGAKSIFLDETPLQNPDGSYNFKGVKWEGRTGTPDQSVIAGFETLNTEVSVGVEIKEKSPVIRTIQSKDVRGITVKINFPNGLNNLDTVWNHLGGTTVSVDVYISYDNAPFIKAGTCTVSKKTNSNYEKAFYFALKDSEEIQIKLVRTTPDSTSANLNNRSNFSGYTLHSGYSLSYPNVALMAYTVKASEFGSNLPNRYLHIKGLIMQVPSNYDPEKRIYNGIWDGTFKRAYTNNPAWFIWWILTDKINGVGGDIPAWAISKTKWDLYEIAKRCDELVDDGKGGKEPRFTFNAWITERKKVFEYLSLICGTCSTLCFWNNNTIGFSQDKPHDIERVFNNSNVIDGQFVYAQTALQSQHSVARVAWHDINNFCKATYEVVEDVDLIHKNGKNILEISLLGCTSRGQAHRAGAFALYSEKFEDKTVSFKVSLDNATIQIGEIIGISDSNYQGISFSGRVKKVEKRTVYLDRAIDFKAGIIYDIILNLSDGTAQKVKIYNPNETTNIVELQDDLRNSVVAGAVFVFVSTEISPQTYRVLDVHEEESTVFSVFAVKYDKRKYDYIEKGYVLPPENESMIPTGKLEPPINLKTMEYLYQQVNGNILSACLFSWDSNDPRASYYEVRYKSLYEELYTNLGVVSNLSVDIKDIEKGWYYFEVRAISDLGLKSAWAVFKTEILGIELPLPNVTGLTTVYKDNRINLVWDAINDIRPFKYQVRKGLDWQSSMIVANTTNRYLPLVSNGIYQVKAVFENAESPIPAILEVEKVIGEGLTGNVIARLDERADFWNGIYDSFLRTENNELMLISGGGDILYNEDIFNKYDVFYDTYDGLLAEYEISEEKQILLSSNNVCNISAEFDAIAYSNSVGIFENNDVFFDENIFAIIGRDWNLTVQIKVRKDGVWGKWEDFYPSDYVGDGFTFRFKVTGDKSMVIYIRQFKISVDVPDRREYWKNILIPADGLQLQFEPPFNGVPAIVATIIEATGQEDVLIEDNLINKTGAFIRVVNKQGQSIEKALNVLAEGY